MDFKDLLEQVIFETGKIPEFKRPKPRRGFALEWIALAVMTGVTIAILGWMVYRSATIEVRENAAYWAGYMSVGEKI